MFKVILISLLVGLAALLVLVIYACCVVAGRADKEYLEQLKQKKDVSTIE